MDLTYQCYRDSSKIWLSALKKQEEQLKYTVKLMEKSIQFQMTYNKKEKIYQLIRGQERFFFQNVKNQVLLLDGEGKVEAYYKCIRDNVIFGGVELLPLLFEVTIQFYIQEGDGEFSFFNPLRWRDELAIIQRTGELALVDEQVEIYFINLKKMGFNIVYHPEKGVLYALDPFSLIEVRCNKIDYQYLKSLLKDKFRISLSNNLKDIFIRTGKRTGRLVIPSERTQEKNHGVLLVSGSGYLDCDGNAGELLWDTLKELAYHLGEHNIISFRYDDRAGGPDVGIAELYEDAEEAYLFLLEHPFVDADNVTVIGHSQGAILAAMLAGFYSEIKKLIILSPQGKPTYEFLFEQYDSFYAEQSQEKRVQLEEFYQILKGTKKMNPENIYCKRYQGEWKRYQELVNLDLLQIYRKVASQIYFLHGENDFQVPPEHSSILADALQNKTGKIARRLFPYLDHFFMKVQLQDIGDYANYQRRMADELKKEITRIILFEEI